MKLIHNVMQVEATLPLY